jgi:hypothetical protein|nr:MAG TPA: protein of unknown function (DUF3599) [Caudoviricetes sp.]
MSREPLEEWRTPVQVEGKVRRDADGYLVKGSGQRLIGGCLVAPGAFTVPGLLTSQTSEQSDEQATIYAPPGALFEVGDRVTIPAGHPLGGHWQVEAPPSPWPKGVAVTINRR